MLTRLSDEGVGGTVREFRSKHLDHPAGVRDETRSSPDQRLATAQKGPVGLVLLAAMDDGMEQSRIEFPHSSKIGGIGLVVLGVAPVDEAEHARIGDDDLVAELTEEPAGPVGVVAGFEN